MNKEKIAAEAEHFFEWPDPARKDFVTLTSCVIFAAVIAEMAIAAERERCAKWREDRAVYYRADDDGPDGREYKDAAPDEREGVESRRSLGALACAEVIRWPANWGKTPNAELRGRPAGTVPLE